ncbi:MAG: 30S ribosomal protein S21 [bacterium]
MLEIRLRENESLEFALKKFKSKYEKSGIMAEIKKREYYMKPSVMKKKKIRKSFKKKTKFSVNKFK